eukprot:m.234732 g.234732  ORF g.234732 m.234732 type:complete len:455 (-) comp12708_c0_seq1:80-1444(-)
MAEDDALAQLREITNLPDDVCMEILANADWNLQRALQDFFEGGESAGRQNTSTTPSAPQLRQRHVPAASAAPVAVATPAPAAAATPAPLAPNDALPAWARTLPPWMHFVLKLAFRTLNAALHYGGSFLMLLGGFFTTLLPTAPAPGREEDFVADFEARYGTEHPPMVAGTWAQAQQRARTAVKFLAVYLDDPTAPRTDAFCRGILCSPLVTSFIAENLILWGTPAYGARGKQLMSEIRLRPTAAPAVVLLACVSGRTTHLGSLTDVRSDEQLLAGLTAAMERGDEILAQESSRREELASAQRIREEQDREYHASLALDREKQARAEAERRAAEAEAAAAAEAEAAQARAEEERLAARKLKAERLPAPPQEGEEAVRIQFRLFTGTRLDRVFRPTDTLQTLYDFVEVSCQDLPSNIGLYSTHPKRLLAAGPSTLRDEKFHARQLVNVDLIDEADE